MTFSFVFQAKHQKELTQKSSALLPDTKKGYFNLFKILSKWSAIGIVLFRCFAAYVLLIHFLNVRDFSCWFLLCLTFFLL